MGKKYCNTTLCLYHFDMAYALAYKAGYMKTLPGHEADYLRLMQKEYKIFNEKLVTEYEKLLERE